MEENYIPLTAIYGIAGTSYGIQLGRKGELLASVLYCGKETIGYKKYECKYDGVINANLIVAWIISVLYIPNINPYSIMKTVYVLVKRIKEVGK